VDKIVVPYSRLYEFYCVQKLGLETTANELGVSRNTVQRRLVDYGIPIRRKSESHVRHTRRDFTGNLEEKAYLLGFRTGDLFVTMSKGAQSETIVASCHTSNQEQIDLVQSLFEPYGHVSVTQYAGGTQQIVAYLNMTFDFLLPKHKAIPDWIFFSPDCFLAFLAGYIDAEGSFCVTRRGVALFQLKSSDTAILTQIHRGLIDHYDVVLPKPRCVQRRGEKSNKHYLLNQDVWTLATGAKGLIYRLCGLLEPYARYSKRRRDMQAVLYNVTSRGLYESV